MVNSQPQEFVEEENAPAAPSPFRRILAILCLAPYAMLGWLRFSQGLTYRNYLSGLELWPGPLYIILSGLAIGLGFSLVLLILIYRAHFAAPFARMICMLFLGWLWIDHIWLGTREAFHYQLVVNTLISAATAIIAFVFVRDRDYQKEGNHDQQ